MTMNGQGKDHTTIAAYAPAGLLVVYALVRAIF